jgi:hypothetical protein
MKLPQSVPILNAFTARVSGREIPQLLKSPTGLARALADTQKVVGHDGVLCLFDPPLLACSCTGQSAAASSGAADFGGDLTAPDEILQRTPLATILDAIEPLQHSLPANATVYTTFAGPGLLWTQLQEAFQSCGMSTGAECDYVLDAVRNVVRTSLEMKADGIALIERIVPGMPSDLQRCHRTVRKLADFYDAGFIVFNQAGSDGTETDIPAHIQFALPGEDEDSGPLIGDCESSATGSSEVITTRGDVPGNLSVQELKQWLRH